MFKAVVNSIAEFIVVLGAIACILGMARSQAGGCIRADTFSLDVASSRLNPLRVKRWFFGSLTVSVHDSPPAIAARTREGT
jgi:hypothetical protein